MPANAEASGVSQMRGIQPQPGSVRERRARVARIITPVPSTTRTG